MSDTVERIEDLIIAAFGDMMQEQRSDFVADLAERAVEMLPSTMSPAQKRQAGETLLAALNDMSWKGQLFDSGHVFDMYN